MRVNENPAIYSSFRMGQSLLKALSSFGIDVSADVLCDELSHLGNKFLRDFHESLR